MASPAELEALLRQPESLRVEKTISRTDTDKFGEAICAFANDLADTGQPGYLFIGARPDGSADGQPITEKLLEALGAIRTDGKLTPSIHMTAQRMVLNGGEMAVVCVQPSQFPPVRYKQQIWVRVAPRRDRANEADERKLTERRARFARTFDARPCLQATLDDLDLRTFTELYRPSAVPAEVVEENHRSIEHQLAALGLWDRAHQAPTHAGLLLLGREPRAFLPGAYVQFVAYPGTSIEDEVQADKRIGGDLPTMMRGLTDLISGLTLSRPMEEAPGGRERAVEKWPASALKELFINALVHRDWESNAPVLITRFDDRIEIKNPGAPYGLRLPDLRTNTAYRNPQIAEIARNLGYANKYGRGLSRADAALLRNGNPPLEIDATDTWFIVTLRSAW